MLELQQVRAGYGRLEVVHGVDLVVPNGAAVALLGANGAGKSTLLRVAAGLLRPNAGRVLFDGEVVTSEPTWRRARRGLCLIPEGRGIFRQLTVHENLAMYVSGKDVAGAIEAAVAAFPVLGKRLAQVAGTLSGGQQQMLAVARAMALEPTCVLADELSVGLAPVVVDEIFEVIGALRTRGHSLLLVEQYVDRALAIADYIYILHKGRIVFVGEPQQCEDHHIFERYMGSAA